MIVFNHLIQDGKLTSTSGRIVIFNGFIEISQGPSRDHNDLLRSLASFFRFNKDEVISEAIRLYWDYYNNGIAVCPVRKLDEDMFLKKEELYKKEILKVMRKRNLYT